MTTSEVMPPECGETHPVRFDQHTLIRSRSRRGMQLEAILNLATEADENWEIQDVRTQTVPS